MPELRRYGGSECRNWEEIMALSAQIEKIWWLWKPKLRRNDGSERRNWEEIVALNAQTEKIWWLWIPKLRRNSGFECPNWEDNGFECLNQEEMAALNAKLKEMKALNVELRRTTLNVITQNKWRLWTPSYKEMVALNAQTIRKWWEGKYALVWHATTTLNPLKGSDWDSMSLKGMIHWVVTRE